MGSLSASSSSSSLPTMVVPQWDYDVFLSFRGEDTRNNFISHLHHALQRSRIHTFMDQELRRGERISPSLEKAIEGSRIAIVVFSPNFAYSAWCLGELLKILQTRESKGQMVRPVFHNVDPSDMRKLTGAFAEIFAKHEERCEEASEMVEKWRDAIREAGNLAGWHLGNRLESELVQDIVEEVSSKLHRQYLDVARHPVGLDKHVQEVRKLLHAEDACVRTVGICGIGGVGKTTIAKAVYNMIADQFEGSSFLANVREISKQYGLDKLQETLLCDILGDTTIKIGYIQTGVNLISQKLSKKRVFLVLDDVDSPDRLRDLIGEKNWFGPGSRILITTSDKDILHAQNAEIYNVDGLNYEDALQLFSWNAFRKPSPTRDYQAPSYWFTKYAKGLPLALIVLGSFLNGKSIPEWSRASDRLRSIPESQVDGILRISFDALEAHEKAIFLDIACFFNGEDKDYVTKMLDRCQFYTDSGLDILAQKSLIYFEANKIWMHDLLQEMGQEIVRQESPENPGKRSRLWHHEDVVKVIRENSGTDAVEGIKLEMLDPEELHMRAKAIKKMKKLRLILTRHIQISGCPGYIDNEKNLLDVLGNADTQESHGPIESIPHELNTGCIDSAGNEKHLGRIRTILYKITCIGALSDFKCIAATSSKLRRVFCFWSKEGKPPEVPGLQGKDDYSDMLSAKEYFVLTKFSRAELLRATNNFADEHKIGIGGFGSVYHGELDDGKEVAIKLVRRQNVIREGSSDQAFLNEIRVLGNINHKNLVRFFGFHEGTRECALVYELMNNHSLFYHLHSHRSSALMSWNARLRVALDVARGIEYLHEYAVPPLIHRDIKSSNILLDDKWNAKVSDFGLAVFVTKGDASDKSPRVLGTVGYVAPEYYSSNSLTTESDVYGYGVVLLELLSGLKAYHWDGDGSRRHVTDDVTPLIIKGEVSRALDPNMPTPLPFEVVALADVAHLAVDCVKLQAKSRPSMTYVVDRLKNALAQCSS